MGAAPTPPQQRPCSVGAAWPKSLWILGSVWIQGDRLALGTDPPQNWDRTPSMNRAEAGEVPGLPGSRTMEAAARRTGSEASGSHFAVQPVIPGHSRSFPVSPLPRCPTEGTPGMPRAAGSAPSSCTRWIRARTRIPTSSPRRRPATSTRSSVSAPAGKKAGTDGVHPALLPRFTHRDPHSRILPPSPAPLLSLQFTT